MNEHIHPGPHPDADQLNAFIEGVLPERERLESIAHLAECSRCRQVVFLAQEHQLVPVVAAAPARRSWFALMPVLGVAFAGVVLIVGTLHFRHATKTPTAVEVSSVEPSPIVAPAQAPAAPKAASPKPESRQAAHAPLQQSAAATDKLPGGVAGASSFHGGVFSASSQPSAATPPQSQRYIQSNNSLSSDGAVNQNQQMVGGQSLRRIPDTNANGTVLAEKLPPFTSPAAPAFQNQQVNQSTLSQQAPLPAAPPQNETVQVSAATAEVTTMDATSESVASVRKRANQRALPSKLPVATSVSIGDRTLALDSGGALFLSRDGGKHWEAVKPVWQGRATQLELLPESPSLGVQAKSTIGGIAAAAPSRAPVSFQMTTDAHVVWVSEDGVHWRVR